MEDPPPFHTGTTELLISVLSEAHSLIHQNEAQPFSLANSGRESARVADDGNYAFYRPTDGLVYPMIQ